MAYLIKLKTHADVNQFVSLMHSYNARLAHKGETSTVGSTAIVYPYKGERIAFAHGRPEVWWYAGDGYATVNQLATILKGC